MSEDVQYKSDTSSVQLRMCSTSEVHLQCEWECVLEARDIISMNEDAQHEQGPLSVQIKMRSMSEAHHQLLIKGSTT